MCTHYIVVGSPRGASIIENHSADAFQGQVDVRAGGQTKTNALYEWLCEWVCELVSEWLCEWVT